MPDDPCFRQDTILHLIECAQTIDRSVGITSSANSCAMGVERGFSWYAGN